VAKRRLGDLSLLDPTEALNALISKSKLVVCALEPGNSNLQELLVS
jgi:hypothetical protein